MSKLRQESNMISAIVILNYNDWKTTVNYIKTIYEYKSLDYIVVVDNASSDDSAKRISSYINDKVHFLCNKNNGGYSSGNNIGAKYAINCLNANNIIISNPDIICSDESIDKILKLLNANEKTVVATGLIHNKNKNDAFKVFSAFGWKVPNYCDMISNCFLSIYKLRREVLKNSNYYPMSYLMSDKHIRVEAVSGCFFSIKSSFLQEIGYFDESTFLYYEETILGYQIAERGKKVMIDTTSPVYHCEDINKNSTVKKRYTTNKRLLSSALIYLKKYLKSNVAQRGFYIACFWIGKLETTIIKRILKSVKFV